MNTYFATDGSYGSADGIIVLDCSKLTEEDWDVIDMTSEDMRGITAMMLVQTAKQRQ